MITYINSGNAAANNNSGLIVKARVFFIVGMVSLTNEGGMARIHDTKVAEKGYVFMKIID